ncbi:lactate/malate family dehydrogenase [Pleomorphomonas oryzae]|uniref:lactate/malate family dehydrogenase n=1 Tax=Pleomorphomonas oryzae TaxID=261934 RepID=UPI000422666E|nr:malate dehydrogenase [Pleomorphomonas oryzae]
MKITVIGMGAVGTEVVGHLLNSGVASEIVVVDQAATKAQAEIWDFSHTTSFINAQNPRLVAGDYADSAGSDIVVITAGAQIKPGQTRDALAQINSAIMKSIIAEVERTSPSAIVLMVTNPVDILVQVVLRHSFFPKERVISLGTIIDTARFMRIVSEHVAIDPKNIFGWVLGDHSDTGFIPWSLCNVCGLDVDSYCELNGLPPIDRAEVRRRVLQVGLDIFAGKGNTNHGIAASVFRIIRAIAGNERSVLPVGTLLQGEYGVSDVVMSVPCVIGRAGREAVVACRFTEEEQAAFEASHAHVLALLAQAEAQTAG